METNIQAEVTEATQALAENVPLGGQVDRILVVDDDPSVVDFLSRTLARKGFLVDEAVSFSQAVRFFEQRNDYSLLLTDLSLPDGNGIDLINRIHEKDPFTVCVLITGYGTMESVIEAIHAQVYDFLPKPFDVQQLLTTIKNGLVKRNLEIENQRLLDELRQEKELLQERVTAATENLESKLREVESLKREITVLYEIMRDIRGDVRIGESLKRLVEYLERALEFDSGFWVVTDSNDQIISTQDWTSGPSRKFDLKDLSPSQLEDLRNLIRSEQDSREKTKAVVNWLGLNLESEICVDQIAIHPFATSSDFFGLVGLVRRDVFENETERLLSLAVSQMVTVWEENAVIQRGSQMASIGELTAEVAHDLRNGLSAFRHVMDYFFEQVDLDLPKNKEYQEVLLENLDRTDDLAKELLTLARPEDERFQTTPMQHLLDRVLKIAGKTLERNGVEHHIDMEDPDLVVTGSIKELSECLINVVMNSVQAMEGGGRLTVSVSSIEKQVEKDRPQTRYVKIMIADTGVGIEPDNLRKVFGRYFTTKKEGTGLGLSMLYKVVKKYLGWVEIESEVGKGTVVKVFLPQV